MDIITDGLPEGYSIKVYRTEKGNVDTAIAYEGDLFVCQKRGKRAIAQCKAAITKRVNADSQPLPEPIHTPPGFVDDFQEW